MASYIVRLLEVLFAELVALLLGMASCVSADVGGRRNTPVLASDNSLLPFTRGLTDTLIGRLRAEFPGNRTFFTEFMDASRAIQDAADREILPAFEVRAA